MKKVLRISAFALAVAALAAVVYFAWHRAAYPGPMRPEQRERLLSQPALKAENYDFDPTSPLKDRIGPPPPFLLDWLRDLDDRPGYKGRVPTAAQREMLAGWFGLMPERMRAVLKEKLLGVYLVDGFLGNGLSNMVIGKDGRKYAWAVLNTEGFSRTLSATLTGREASVFKGGGVSVDCGGAGEPPGIFYPFFHEMTHAYDYVAGVTPYVEKEWYELIEGGPPRRKQRWDVWAAYEKPLPEHDHPLRAKLRFYGIGGGPLLDISEAAALYAWLGESPFTSLYGAQNWAEDAVELMVYKAVRARLGRPCAVRYGAGKEFRPGPLAESRAGRLETALTVPLP
ncbi:MAG: hypothetical protein FD189_1784 [Elusimicrobia bacterium]|nr:MAG: hypothetical protein FD154_1927 [Elusimicrobiota bacterium]KAF0154600.1 MAG: hypothetical protein FD189_1784 [Elusimicrobiota bacterium]